MEGLTVITDRIADWKSYGYGYGSGILFGAGLTVILWLIWSSGGI